MFLMRNTNIDDYYYYYYYYYENNDPEKRLMLDSLTTPSIIIEPSPKRPTQGTRI